MKRILFGTLSALVLSATLAPFAAAGNLDFRQTNSTELNTPVAASSEVLVTGDFVPVGKDAIAGTARIIEENGKRYLVLNRDFSTTQGPDLLVTLYRESVVPGSIAEADYISLAPLEQFSGEQRYEIVCTIARG
ncbi:MAG: DM13 domain-containing protein [Cyanobacteria bacterium J06641_5]